MIGPRDPPALPLPHPWLWELSSFIIIIIIISTSFLTLVVHANAKDAPHPCLRLHQKVQIYSGTCKNLTFLTSFLIQQPPKKLSNDKRLRRMLGIKATQL